MNSTIEQPTIVDIRCPVCSCRMEVVYFKGYGLGLQCPKCEHQIPLEECDAG